MLKINKDDDNLLTGRDGREEVLMVHGNGHVKLFDLPNFFFFSNYT